MSLPELFSSETQEPAAAFPPPGFVPGPSQVNGIEVYVPASASEQRPEVVDFKCPKCGATTAFSVQTGQLTCEYCGYSETPEQHRLGRAAEAFEFQVETIQRSERGWGETRKELACQRCGGVVSTPPDAITFACPFCGSNQVLFREPLEDVLRPRYLIPFKVDPRNCQEITRLWLGKSWMIPSDLRELARQDPNTLGKYNPIYIPYWTFTATCNATWQAMVGHVKTERTFVNGKMEERQTIEWRPESGKVNKTFTDLLVPGTTRLNLAVLGKVDGYNIADLILYEPRYLAGMQSQAYDLPLEEAWDAGRQIMREKIRQNCLDRASSSHIRNFTMNMDFNEESWRYILAPIYTSVYRYNEKTFQILINGQTGKIAGPRPVDWEKVWLVIAGMLSPGLLLSLVGWLLSGGQEGSYMVGIGIFLLVVAVTIGVTMLLEARGLEHV